MVEMGGTKSTVRCVVHFHPISVVQDSPGLPLAPTTHCRAGAEKKFELPSHTFMLTKVLGGSEKLDLRVRLALSLLRPLLTEICSSLLTEIHM